MVVIGSDAGCTIGRSVDADVLVDDAQVSRNHLIIEPHADTWRIRDVSSNGTWHDGARIGPGGIVIPSSGTLRVRLGAPDGPEVVIKHQPGSSSEHRPATVDPQELRTVLPPRPGVGGPPRRPRSRRAPDASSSTSNARPIPSSPG